MSQVPELEEVVEERIDCWNQIGVWGDTTCPILERVIHCHNCEIFAAAGRSLLRREAPGDYLAEWIDALAHDKQESESTDSVSVLIFRLGKEWLALSTRVFNEVTEPRVIRTLPHKTGAIFKGLVNIRGEVQMCVSIAELLGLDESPPGDDARRSLVQPRMVVIAREGQMWVFRVDEVAGIQRFQLSQLQKLPITVSRDKAAYSRGILEYQGRNIGLLEDDLIFSSLRRRVLGD